MSAPRTRKSYPRCSSNSGALPEATVPAVLYRQLQRTSGISNFEYGVLARLSMADEHAMRLSDLARECDSAQPRLAKRR